MVSETDKTSLLDDIKLLTLVNGDVEETLVKALIEYTIKGIVKDPENYKYAGDSKLDVNIAENVQILLRNRRASTSGNDTAISILSQEDLNDLEERNDSDTVKVIPNRSLKAYSKYNNSNKAFGGHR